MWEVWRQSPRFAIMGPTAWFGTEADAREYCEYLATVGEAAQLHYNETATMPDWDAPSEWHAPAPMSANCE